MNHKYRSYFFMLFAADFYKSVVMTSLLFLTIDSQASEYHITIESQHPDKNHRNTMFVANAVKGEDLYLVLAVNGVDTGYHGTQRFDQQLVKISKSGELSWKALLPKGASKLHAVQQGFLLVTQHQGANPQYGSQYREVAVWQLDDDGNPLAKTFTSTGLLSIQSSAMEDQELYLVLTNNVERNTESRLLHFDNKGTLQSNRVLVIPDKADSPGTILGRSSGATRIWHQYDEKGELQRRWYAPNWSTYIIDTDQGGVYFVSSIRQPYPDFGGPRWHSPLEIRYESNNENETWDYKALHSLDIRKVRKARDGGLWLLGASDDFAAVYKYRNGDLEFAKRFNSRLKESAASQIIELENGELIIIGSTSNRGFLTSTSDVFVLRTGLDSSFLSQYERCAADADAVSRLDMFLSQNGMINPGYSSGERIQTRRKKELVSPFYQLVPEPNAMLPPPDQCSGKDKHKYLKYLQELASLVTDNPPPDNDPEFTIRLYVSDSPVEEEGYISTKGPWLKSNLGNARHFYQKISTEIYPKIREYQTLRRRLYKQVGVSLEIYKARLATMSLTIDLYNQLFEGWEKLNIDEKLKLEAAMPKIYLKLGENGEAVFGYPVSNFSTNETRRKVEMALFGEKANTKTSVPIESVFRHLLDVHLIRLREGLNSSADEWIEKQGSNMIPANLMLNVASKSGYLKEAKLALESGAEIKAGACWGDVMLNNAAERGFTEIAQLLLEHGADINQQGANSETALHIALEERSLGVVRLLLEKQELDVTLKDSQLRTPLDVANEFRHQLPDWVFLELNNRHAPGGDPTRAADYISKVGFGCDEPALKVILVR